LSLTERQLYMETVKNMLIKEMTSEISKYVRFQEHKDLQAARTNINAMIKVAKI
jgi:hypothetical protein